MRLLVITPPSELILRLYEALDHLRVTDPAEHGYVQRLIRAAHAMIEADTLRAMATQTLRLELDGWPPSRVITLPRPPLQSVTSISYTDAGGVMRTLAADQYLADAVAEPARIMPAHGVSWPAVRQGPGAVTIDYMAGHDTSRPVREHWRQAALMLIGHWYEHRESVVVGTVTRAIELGYRALIADAIVYGDAAR